MSSPEVARQDHSVSIYVLRHETDYIVRPALAAAKCGGTLRFVNVTDQSITVFLPQGFSTDRLKVEARTSEPVVAPRVDSPTALHYSVFSEEAQALCRGESNPIIIIEP